MGSTTWGALRKQAEDASKPLPEDWYDVVVSKSESTVASTGSPMIKLTLDVTSGPQAGSRKVFTQLVMKVDSPFVVQRFFEHLAAFGLDDKFFDALPDNIEEGMPIIASALDGRSARAKIGPREYQGTPRDNVETFTAGAKSNSPMSGFGGGIAPAGPPTPQAAPPVPQGPPTPQTPPTLGSAPSAPPQLTF